MLQDGLGDLKRGGGGGSGLRLDVFFIEFFDELKLLAVVVDELCIGTVEFVVGLLLMVAAKWLIKFACGGSVVPLANALKNGTKKKKNY